MSRHLDRRTRTLRPQWRDPCIRTCPCTRFSCCHPRRGSASVVAVVVAPAFLVVIPAGDLLLSLLVLPPHPSPPVLLLSHMLHPIHHLPIQPLLHRDMRHPGRSAGPMPMLFSRRKPNHIPRPNLLHRPTFTTNPTTTSRNNQRLPQRMRMPGRPCSRLKRDARPGHQRRIWRRKQRINPHRPRKPIRRPLTRSRSPYPLNLHLPILSAPPSGCPIHTAASCGMGGEAQSLCHILLLAQPLLPPRCTEPRRLEGARLQACQ